MRTTIDIPDEIFRHAKAEASLRGMTLKRFITDAIGHELTSRKNLTNPQNRVHFPLVATDNPGNRQLTPDKAAEILAQEDIDELTGR